MNSLKTIITTGLIASTLLLSAGCETTTTSTTLSPPIPVNGEDAFDMGAGKAPSAQTLYRMGMILAAQDKLASAEAVQRSVIRQYPEFLPAYSELARLLVHRGEVERAIETLDEAVLLVGEDPVSHNNRGMCLMMLDRFGAARESFSIAAALDPRNSRYAANHALAAGMLGKYDEALDLYHDFLQPARAHHNLGVICEARNDTERAAIEFALAAGYDPAPVRASRDSGAPPTARLDTSANEVEMGAQR